MGEKEDFIRTFSAAINDGNLNRAMGLIGPECIIDMSGSGAPYRSIHHGHAGVRMVFEDFLDAFEEYTWEPREMVELAPDQLCVTTEVTGIGKGSGVEVVAHGAWIFRFATAS
jgi:hypothetical protein